MASINDFMSASCEYTHKDSKGRPLSVGRTKIDWKGNVHAIQKNLKNGEITESVFQVDGILIKTKVRTPWYIHLLRLVGLKRK